jgi:hypothetical protein
MLEALAVKGITCPGDRTVTGRLPSLPVTTSRMDANRTSP